MKKGLLLHRLIVLFFLLSLQVFPLSAQTFNAYARIDSSRILIGDHVRLLLSVEVPKNASLVWPALQDTLSAQIEVVTISKIDTLMQDGDDLMMFNQMLTITCFDSGYFVIPPFRFVYTLPGDTLRYRQFTEPLLLYVNTVPVDTTQAIKDIKAPLRAPLTFMEILPWLAGGLILLHIILFIIYMIVRKRKNKPIFGSLAQARLPAHIKALKALEELRIKRLWHSGKDKEYHSALSEIVRVYLWDRYGVQAAEMTTPETMDAIKMVATLENEQYKHLYDILEMADLVKFAKHIPLPDEHDRSMRLAVAFVETTADIPKEADEKNSLSDETMDPEEREDME